MALGSAHAYRLSQYRVMSISSSASRLLNVLPWQHPSFITEKSLETVLPSGWQKWHCMHTLWTYIAFFRYCNKLNLVSWCFEPSQPQRTTLGLNTNFTLSYSFHKSSYHKSCFLRLYIFRGHSKREPASSKVTYFILRAYTGTGISHSQHWKKLGEVSEKCRWMDRKGRNKQGRNPWQ